MLMSGFPPGDDPIEVPRRPLSSVTSISYYDSSDNSQTLATTVYDVDIGNQQLPLKYNQSWPSTSDRYDAVSVVFVAGYGSSASDVKQLVKQAMLLQIGKWFEDREMMANNLVYTDQAYERIVSRLMRSSYP